MNSPFVASLSGLKHLCADSQLCCLTFVIFAGRFEDYADEDLESWHTELHSKDPKDNRTKANKTPSTRRTGSGLSDLGIPGVSVLSGVPNSQNDFGFGCPMFSDSPTKGVRVDRGYHNARIVGGSPNFMSNVVEKQGSGLVFNDDALQAGQGASEPLWGHVLEVAQHEGSGLQGQVIKFLGTSPSGYHTTLGICCVTLARCAMMQYLEHSNMVPVDIWIPDICPVLHVLKLDFYSQVVVATTPKHEDSGRPSLYAANDQSIDRQAVLSLNLHQMDLGNQQPVLVLPNSPQPTQPPPVSCAGEASPPSGGFGSAFSAGGASGQATGDHQMPSVDGGDHTPLPPDSQILKIIPCNWGVFGLMYVRPGHSGTGAAVWDGRAIHDMGMFTTKSDAHQACTAGTDIVVKLHNGPMSQVPSQGSDGPVILTTLQDNDNLTNAGREAVGKGQLPLVSSGIVDSNAAGQLPVGGGRELHRPANVAHLNSSQQNLLRLLSINSEDLNKYLGQIPAASQEVPLLGTPSDHNKSFSAIAELVKQDNGNLGSLLHWDSWNSSILSLISKHGTTPAQGTSVDPVKQDTEVKEPGPQSKEVGGGATEATALQPAAAASAESPTVGAVGAVVPSWLKELGSLAELGSITFQESGNLSWLVRQNDDCFLLQQQGSGFGSEVVSLGNLAQCCTMCMTCSVMQGDRTCGVLALDLRNSLNVEIPGTPSQYMQLRAVYGAFCVG